MVSDITFYDFCSFWFIMAVNTVDKLQFLSFINGIIYVTLTPESL